MKQGQLLILALLMSVKLLSGEQEVSTPSQTTPTEGGPAASDTPTPTEKPASPKKSAPPKKPAPPPKPTMTTKEYKFGNSGETSTDPSINDIKLEGKYQGEIILNEYFLEPFKVQVFKYTSMVDQKWLGKVDVRVTEGTKGHIPIVFGCRVCGLPKVNIGNNQVVVYNGIDVYGILITKGKSLVVMRHNVCTEETTSSSIVKFRVLSTAECGDVIQNMKSPERNALVQWFWSIFRKYFSTLLDMLQKTPPPPPLPAKAATPKKP